MNLITVTGEKQKDCGCDVLYRPDAEPEYEEKVLKWIPYYAWANRGVGEMSVWIRR